MSDPKTTTAAYLSSGSAILFGMNANELAAMIGAACALVTMLINWYYKHRQFKLSECRSACPVEEE